MYTTLNEIRKHNPCDEGWEKLLKFLGKSKADDEPLAYMTILESNGLNDAIWALVCHEDQGLVRKFACDCAEHVLHVYEKQHPGDNRLREAIAVARKFADGEATKEELAHARDSAKDACDATWAAAQAAAWAAAGTAVWAAPRGAARSASAARTAAWTAARDVAWAAAWDDKTAAWTAARDVAWAAEEEWQKNLFIKYFGGGNDV